MYVKKYFGVLKVVVSIDKFLVLELASILTLSMNSRSFQMPINL